MVRRILVVILAFVLGINGFSQHNIQIIISSLPINSPDSNLFVAGSFNGWNPQDKNFQFRKDAGGILTDNAGSFLIATKLDNGTYEFKITRGGWDKVECSDNGSDIQNRNIKIESDTIIYISVRGWKDKFEMKPRVSTASKNVHLVDTAFKIPQLNRERRVWIYLPPDYSGTKKNYPVLYMQDGQNVFDDLTSFAGEWGVDETLDSISLHKKEMIVVAVDHGGAKRINEYCPYDMEKYGKGEGDLYLDFLVKTLKPFIDKNYRTKKDKPNTFIAGSSMGGLISMYAVLKYPKVFGGAGVFSPAFWVGPRIFDDIKTRGGKVNSRIYFYCGGQENETMRPDMEKAFEEMRKVSESKMLCVIRPDGKHTESVWKEEFPLFYLWLLEK